MKQLRSLVLLASLGPVAATAQEAEPGGVFFTFEIDQSIEATTDRDLATPEEEESVQAITDLRFGAVTETRAQRLSFDLGTGVRAAEQELISEDISLGFGYSRNSADSVLEVSLNALRSDIEFLRDASDFINADGEIVLPEDFEDLTGTGTRTATTLSANLRWRETDPLGYRVSFSQQLLRYDDASAALLNSDTGTVSAGVRLNINEVTTGNVDLSYTQTDEVGEPLDDRTTLTGGLTFARPLGDLTMRVSASRDEDEDISLGASIDRRITMPRSTLAGSIGVVEDEDGEARLTGSINYSYPRPTGQIDLSAIRSLAPGADRSTTTLRAIYAQDINPVSSLRFAIDFAEASDSDGSDRLASGGVSGSYGIDITRLWQLNLGARANVRDDDGSRSRSNTLFVTLERDIAWRP